MLVFEDNVQRILAIMKETFKGGPFVTFYDGDPEAIPVFNLPALIVSKASDTGDIATTFQEDVTEQLVIKAVFNKKDDWANDVDPTNMTERKIREVIGARDRSTGEYLPQTIKGALRTKLSTNNIVIGENMRTELGIRARASTIENTDAYITEEGHVTIDVDYYVPINEE